MTLAGINALIKVTQERVARLRAAGDYAGACQAGETLSGLFAQRSRLQEQAG
jgi:hypothetical protein